MVQVENPGHKADQLPSVLGQLTYLSRALALAWTAARQWTLVWFILLVVQGVLPIATVYLTRQIVDTTAAALGAGGSWTTVAPLLLLGALMAGVMLLSEILRSIAEWIRASQAERVKDHIFTLIHEKSIDVDLAFYESPEYYDHLHRARMEAQYRPLVLLEHLGGLLQNSISLVAMAAILTSFGLWLPFALLVSTLPALLAVLRHSLRRHQWRLRITADQRRQRYYDWLLTDTRNASEVRLFGLGQHFIALFRELRGRLRTEHLQLVKEEGLARLGAAVIALAVTGASVGWMVLQLLHGRATLGDLALFYQAFQQGQRMMRSALTNAGQVYTNSFFLGDLFKFLSLRPQVQDPEQPCPAPPVAKGIRFHQVTFNYPDSQQAVLEDFDLTIPAGQIVAIVGKNGAGKSTLFKLICRLYDPQAGRIEVDGRDLRELSLRDLRALLTVLFQQPMRYNATVSENIALGRLSCGPSMTELKDAAEAAGADALIQGLPGGYQTLLGKWFAGGTELSTGEWQRLALARAFLRQAPIILLDEPTSAMDSWTELTWMKRFRELAAGRTALVITHRFTTAMQADMIHVVDRGRVIESGSHADLLALGGRYARSWEAQMSQAESLRSQ